MSDSKTTTADGAPKLATMFAPRDGATYSESYSHLDSFVLVSAGRWPNMLSPREFKTGDKMNAWMAHLLSMRRGHSAGSAGAREDTIEKAFAAVQEYKLPTETWTAKEEIADAYVQDLLSRHIVAERKSKNLKELGEKELKAAMGSWGDRANFRSALLTLPGGGKHGAGFPAFVKKFLTEDKGPGEAKPVKEKASGFSM